MTDRNTKGLPPEAARALKERLSRAAEEEAKANPMGTDAIKQAVAEKIVESTVGEQPTPTSDGLKKIQVEFVQHQEVPRLRWVQNRSDSMIVISDLNRNDPEFPGISIDMGEKVDLMDVATAEEINKSRQLKILTTVQMSVYGAPMLCVFDTEADMNASTWTVPPNKYELAPKGSPVQADPNEYDDALKLYEARQEEIEKRLRRDASAQLGDRPTTTGFDVDKAMKNHKWRRGYAVKA